MSDKESTMGDTLTPEQIAEGRLRFEDIAKDRRGPQMFDEWRLFDDWVSENFAALLTTAERAVAEHDALLFTAGKLRLCVTCGKLVDAEKVKRGDDLPECRSILDGVEVATCTFDLTPREAIEYWRSEAATLRAEVERLRVALFLTAPHCQGGNGKAGKVAAEMLGIPFPIRMDALEAQAKSEGRDTRALWPWLYQMREARVSTTLKENR